MMPLSFRKMEAVPAWRVPLIWRLFSIVEVPDPPTYNLPATPNWELLPGVEVPTPKVPPEVAIVKPWAMVEVPVVPERVRVPVAVRLARERLPENKALP